MSVEIPHFMNIYDPNPDINQRLKMNCIRSKTVCEIHLIFYLILTVILCTSIVSYVYYQNNRLKQNCAKDSTKTDKSSYNCNESHLSLMGRNQNYLDLNFQPLINDGRINALVVKSRDSIELMRKTLNIPCILVGISINGTDLWTEGMGFSDVENGVKCHKHSAFSLGTMSKPMISLLLASLKDSEKLNFDDNIEGNDLTQTYPQISKERINSSDPLTLRKVLSETDVFLIENSTKAHIYCNKYIDIFKTPFSDTKSRYYLSTLSWDILINKLQSDSVLNKSFDTSLNDFLFKRIHLTSTHLAKEHEIIPYRLYYYHKNNSTLENYGSDNEIPVSCWPSSAIISTVPDMLIFGREVIDIYHNKQESTINSTTFKQFISRQTQHPINQDIYYGLGWMLFNRVANHTIFGYSGQTSGSSYLFMVRPDNNFVITLFANLGGVEKELLKIAENIINDFETILLTLFIESFSI